MRGWTRHSLYPGWADIVVGVVGLGLLLVALNHAGAIPEPLRGCGPVSILHLELAGTAARMSDHYSCLNPSQFGRIPSSLLVDSFFVVPLYVMLLMWWCSVGHRVLRTHTSSHLAWVASIAALLAGVLDIVENISLWQVHDAVVEGRPFGAVWPGLAFGAAVPKFMLLVFAGFMALRSLGRMIRLKWNGGPDWIRWHAPTIGWRQNTKPVADNDVGVALSSGGIRSATFNMGVLQSLGPLAGFANYISAVSAAVTSRERCTCSAAQTNPRSPHHSRRAHKKRTTSADTGATSRRRRANGCTWPPAPLSDCC